MLDCFLMSVVPFSWTRHMFHLSIVLIIFSNGKTTLPFSCDGDEYRLYIYLFIFIIISTIFQARAVSILMFYALAPYFKLLGNAVK